MQQGFLTVIKDIVQDRKNGLIDEDEFVEKICTEFNKIPLTDEANHVLRCISKVIPNDALSLLYDML